MPNRCQYLVQNPLTGIGFGVLRSDVEFKIKGKTDIGSMREENQDSLGEVALDGGVFLTVADGMGGYAGGSLASKTAVQALMEWVTKNWKGKDTDVKELLRDAVSDANRAVRDKALGDEELRDMGTTCVCLLVKGEEFYVAHVGDSRAYLMRDGTFSLLTEDHTVIQQLISKGKVGPLEASYHPSAGILMRCLGQLDEVLPDLWGPEPLKQGDLVLLCSDGLTGMVYEDEIAHQFIDEGVEDAVDSLIRMANEAGGFDNITVQVLQVGELPVEARSWKLIVDSPEGLALASAEGRLPANLDQGRLRHTISMAAVEDLDLSEPTVPVIEEAQPWKPEKERMKRLLLVAAVAGLLLGAGIMFLLCGSGT